MVGHDPDSVADGKMDERQRPVGGFRGFQMRAQINIQLFDPRRHGGGVPGEARLIEDEGRGACQYEGLGHELINGDDCEVCYFVHWQGDRRD